jgi:imidazoleglycerol-phosphate dehydratase/histidinol-phosphatase
MPSIHFNKLFQKRYMKKVLFIDRDGTLIKEAPPTYQIDHFEKLVFFPAVFQSLSSIVKEFDFE